MTRGDRRPERYRVRISTPDWTAELLIESGFCTSADGHLADCIGKSAAWLKGHLIFKGWRGTMLPPLEPVQAQERR
jgi:hypothetical protein